MGRGCRLTIAPEARLVLKDGCAIDDGSTIAVYANGCVELGPGCFVGHHCTLAAHESITLGAGVYLAELVSIRDHDHDPDFPPSAGRVNTSPVVVGRDAWIGAKATVTRGTQIGEKTVVGANAVARGELPPWTVCVGVPARVVREISREQAD